MGCQVFPVLGLAKVAKRKPSELHGGCRESHKVALDQKVPAVELRKSSFLAQNT